MYIGHTWQDWQEAGEDKAGIIQEAIAQYKISTDAVTARTAADYFAGANTEIAKKTVLSVARKAIKDEKTGRTIHRQERLELAGARIPGSFLMTFVVQQNQHLLGNGVSFGGEQEEETDPKDLLGVGFDTVLAQMGEQALLAGVSWAYWNMDHVEMLKAVDGPLAGFVALLDEETGAPMVGLQYWQLSSERPMYVRVFEPDGVTVYKQTAKTKLEVTEEKRPYIQTVQTDAAGSEVVGGRNWDALPIVPLYANEERRSELTPSIKAKIDAYDRIASDLSDNLDRANDVYWVLNNFGGTQDDVLELLEQVRTIKAVAAISDGTGNQASVEPRTIEVPYQARAKAMELLRDALYADYMALDTKALTGGSLTNVAIKVASANLNLKADRYEWEVLTFMRRLLRLIGHEELSDRVTLTRRSITSDTETIQAIYMAREDLDQRTALQLNPMVNPDDIDGIIERTQAEKQAGAPSMEDIDRLLNGINGGSNGQPDGGGVNGDGEAG